METKEKSGLREIGNLVKPFSDAQDTLVERVANLKQDILDVKKNAIVGIRSAVSMVVNRKAKVITAVNENRELFEKPRTQMFEGVKVGLQQIKAKVEWDKNDKKGQRVVNLIKEKFPEMVDTLIVTKEEPNVKNLLKLSVKELTKIGCVFVDKYDEIVVKTPKIDIDKYVDGLMKEELEIKEEAA